MDFRWTLNSPGRGIPFDWYSARWTGTITVPATGVARIGVEGNDGYRLYLDDKLIIDNWQKRSFGTRTVPVALAPGIDASHQARVLRDDRRRAREADLGRRRHGHVARGDRREAVAAAKSSDVAVSSRASKKASSAIARSSGCPAGRPD